MNKIFKTSNIIILVIITVAICFFMYSFTVRTSKVSIKTQNLASIVQQKLIIIQSVAKADEYELRVSAQSYEERYKVKLRDFCRREYFIRSNCNLDELNERHLKELSQLLEEGILEIVRIQEELYGVG